MVIVQVEARNAGLGQSVNLFRLKPPAFHTVAFVTELLLGRVTLGVLGVCAPRSDRKRYLIERVDWQLCDFAQAVVLVSLHQRYGRVESLDKLLFAGNFHVLLTVLDVHLLNPLWVLCGDVKRSPSKCFVAVSFTYRSSASIVGADVSSRHHTSRRVRWIGHGHEFGAWAIRRHAIVDDDLVINQMNVPAGPRHGLVVTSTNGILRAVFSITVVIVPSTDFARRCKVARMAQIAERTLLKLP